MSRRERLSIEQMLGVQIEGKILGALIPVRINVYMGESPAAGTSRRQS